MNSPKFGGADSIENYLSKIWGGWRPPKLAGGKPHDPKGKHGIATNSVRIKLQRDGDAQRTVPSATQILRSNIYIFLCGKDANSVFVFKSWMKIRNA